MTPFGLAFVIDAITLRKTSLTTPTQATVPSQPKGAHQETQHDNLTTHILHFCLPPVLPTDPSPRPASKCKSISIFESLLGSSQRLLNRVIVIRPVAGLAETRRAALSGLQGARLGSLPCSSGGCSGSVL